MFFVFLCLLLVILLLKLFPEHGAEAHSSVPERKQAMMHLMEKMYVLDKLHSSVSSSTVGHAFDINESIMCFT